MRGKGHFLSGSGSVRQVNPGDRINSVPLEGCGGYMDAKRARSFSIPWRAPLGGGWTRNRSPRVIRGIIPPHILKHMMDHGDETTKTMALRNFIGSERIRGIRHAFGGFYVATPAGGKCLRVFDVKNGHEDDLPGEILKDPTKSKDPAAKEAFTGADATYSLYSDIYGRASIDDLAMCIDSSVHFMEDYDNAFWNGQQMVFGDGDGTYFNRFTIAIDVIGHELTHGVTEYEAGLVYSGQPGALNEHFSDVFGILVKQRIRKETAEKSNWLIGEGLFTKKVKGKALRSMKEPGTAYDDPTIGRDPQPGHMRDYQKLPVSEDYDYGGVHINSGIPNRAFYITATEIGGYAWEKAGKIWYNTLINGLRSRSGFPTAAKRTYQIAGLLFGDGSKEQKAVKKGWTDVGVKISS